MSITLVRSLNLNESNVNGKKNKKNITKMLQLTTFIGQDMCFQPEFEGNKLNKISKLIAEFPEALITSFVVCI